MDYTQQTSNPALLGTWFRDPSEPVATRVLAMCAHNADKSVSSTRYAAHDQLKSVSALFDSSGIRQAKFEYAPYGETLTAQGAWAESMPLRYSSEYRDEELGLIYYNYRHYNPMDGRWISRDPIEEEGGENLYKFINNSINLFDKNGLKWEVVCKEKLDCAEPVPGFGSGRGRVVYGGKESLTYAVKELIKDGKTCYKLELKGILTLKLEMLDRKHAFFDRGRFPRFDKKWGVPRSNNLEWQAVRAHERDHRNTFTIGARQEFDKLNEQYDGKIYLTKEEAEKKKNNIYDQALEHSQIFDKPKYNQGDMYKEYPFKYEPEK